MCRTKRRNTMQAQEQTVTPPLWDYLPQAAKVVETPSPAKYQRKHPVTVPLKITDLGHSAWGPRHFHRLTLLCQGLRYLRNQLGSTTSAQPSPRSPLHLVHQLKMSISMGSLHPAANTKTLCTSRATADGPSRPPPTLASAEMSLCKRHLQGGRDADGATVARPTTGPGFHLETPYFRTPQGRN
jgi:hypothetical protein